MYSFNRSGDTIIFSLLTLRDKTAWCILVANHYKCAAIESSPLLVLAWKKKEEHWAHWTSYEMTQNAYAGPNAPSGQPAVAGAWDFSTVPCRTTKPISPRSPPSTVRSECLGDVHAGPKRICRCRSRWPKIFPNHSIWGCNKVRNRHTLLMVESHIWDILPGLWLNLCE